MTKGLGLRVSETIKEHELILSPQEARYLGLKDGQVKNKVKIIVVKEIVEENF